MCVREPLPSVTARAIDVIRRGAWDIFPNQPARTVRKRRDQSRNTFPDFCRRPLSSYRAPVFRRRVSLYHSVFLSLSLSLSLLLSIYLPLSLSMALSFLFAKCTGTRRRFRGGGTTEVRGQINGREYKRDAILSHVICHTRGVRFSYGIVWQTRPAHGAKERPPVINYYQGPGNCSQERIIFFSEKIQNHDVQRASQV